VFNTVSDADEVRAPTTDQAAALAWVASTSHTTGCSCRCSSSR
jgi:hypothetical protein